MWFTNVKCYYIYFVEAVTILTYSMWQPSYIKNRIFKQNTILNINTQQRGKKCFIRTLFSKLYDVLTKAYIFLIKTYLRSSLRAEITSLLLQAIVPTKSHYQLYLVHIIKQKYKLKSWISRRRRRRRKLKI